MSEPMNRSISDDYIPPYPGTPLRVGSTGSDVGIMQRDLNTIRKIFPQLNALVVDGKFGNATKDTVMQYQSAKGLTVDGVIGKTTWNAIAQDYASIMHDTPDVYPGTPLSQGSTGVAVVDMQTKLNRCSDVYTAINKQTVDGIFGTNMYSATIRFQKQHGLTADGVIGINTWDKIVSVHASVEAKTPAMVTTPYPGTVLEKGSSGDNVRFVQSYYNGSALTGWPKLTIDGVYGTNTANAIIRFQEEYKLVTDGKVGSKTWSTLVTQFNAALS